MILDDPESFLPLLESLQQAMFPPFNSRMYRMKTDLV